MANNSTLKKIQIDNVTYDIGGGAYACHIQADPVALQAARQA